MYELDCQATRFAQSSRKKGTISDAESMALRSRANPRQNLKDVRVISLQCQWGPSRVIIAAGARRERAAAPLTSQRDGGGRDDARGGRR